MRDLTESIRIDGSNTDALYNRGLLYARVGELAQAADDFSAVIRAHPGEAASYKLRAEVQRKWGTWIRRSRIFVGRPSLILLIGKSRRR